MNTIALRFGEHFSPECGTILAHQEIIDEYGYVWYGKMGTKVGKGVADDIMSNDDPIIILIQSGRAGRYFAHISEIKYDTPEIEKVPTYYRDNNANFKTWFKVTRFEEAPKDILSKCFVCSSNRPVGEVSKHSMSPYFIIKYDKEV